MSLFFQTSVLGHLKTYKKEWLNNYMFLDMDFAEVTCRTTIDKISKELENLEIIVNGFYNDDTSIRNNSVSVSGRHRKSNNFATENGTLSNSVTENSTSSNNMTEDRVSANGTLDEDLSDDYSGGDHDVDDGKVTKERHVENKGTKKPQYRIKNIGKDKAKFRFNMGNEKRKGKKKKSKVYPRDADVLFSNLLTIINNTVDLMQDSLAELVSDRVSKCCKDLESMNPIFRAYPTGSRALGLCDHTGDLDVFLDIGEMYFGYKYQHAYLQERLVLETAHSLRRDKHIWRQVLAITSARTPIIKAFHIPSSLNCDISFRNALGYLNTGFIKSLMEYLPILKPSILLLKCWCRSALLDHHFRSYFITIMLVFYLQTENVLPSVAKMRSYYKGKPIHVSGWEVHYSTRPAVFEGLSPPPTLIQVLHGFFNYYGNVYQFDKEVVCPLLGYTILKDDFKCCEDLPEEMNSYKNMVSQTTNQEREEHKINTYLVSHPSKELFRFNSASCVQDPFDLSHNLTKAIPRSFVAKFKMYCETEAVKFNMILRSSDYSMYDDEFWTPYVNPEKTMITINTN